MKCQNLCFSGMHKKEYFSMLFGKTFTQSAESKLQESSALSKLSSPD